MPSATPSPSAGSAPKPPSNPNVYTYTPTGTATTKVASPFGAPAGVYDYQNVGDMYNQSVLDGVEYQYVNGGKKQEMGGTNERISLDVHKTQDYAQAFATMWTSNPAGYKAMQQELYLSGHYGSSTPTLGVYTLKDQSALNDAMRSYLGVVNPNSSTAMSFSEFLARSSQAGNASGQYGGGGGGGGGSVRAPIQYTSSKTLDEVANNQGQAELGRELTTPEQGAFVKKYHGEELSAYNGGTENAGDPAAEAKNHIDATATAEHQTHLSAGYAQQILTMLGVTG